MTLYDDLVEEITKEINKVEDAQIRRVLSLIQQRMNWLDTWRTE